MNASNISPVELGKRLSATRRNRNVSQEAAANHIGISRPTLIAIEKGTRPVKAAEIAALSELYGCSVHELVSSRAEMSDLVPQFRITNVTDVTTNAADAAVREFKAVCDDYLWLEGILNAPMPRYRYNNEYPLPSGSTQVLAEEIASLERSRLNLGMGPIANLLDVLESDVGLRVFVLPLSDFRIAGMFAFTERLGGCILVNGNHPPTRQVWSVAHEYAHFLTERYQTEVTVLVEYERKPRSEQFADMFAASFLMPAAGIRQRFNVVRRSKNDFTVADICYLADQYGVSVEAMTRRLERLSCIKPGTWDKLSATGFTSVKAQKHLNIVPKESVGVRLPDRYVRFAVQAFQEEHITEGQLARILRCARVEAREFVEKLSSSREVDSYGNPYELDVSVEATHDLALIEGD